MTTETKEKVAEMYRNKSNKVADIARALNISRGQVAAIAREMGCEPRLVRGKGKYKICPRCKRKAEIKGALYCPYCGEDLRTEKELLINKAQILFSMLQPLPSSDKDTARDIINELISYLKKEGKNE